MKIIVYMKIISNPPNIVIGIVSAPVPINELEYKLSFNPCPNTVNCR